MMTSWYGWIPWCKESVDIHYSDVIMTAMASQITGAPNVCSTGCSGVDQRKHRSSATLAFVRGTTSPLTNGEWSGKWPFNDVIMRIRKAELWCFLGTWPDQTAQKTMSSFQWFLQHGAHNCNADEDLSHKLHNAQVPYPTMHQFVTEMCTHVHISVT